MPGARPRVARIVSRGQPAFREVHRHSLGTGVERAADVLLGLVGQVLLELLARVAVHLFLERVEKSEHRGSDHGLLHRLGGVLDRLPERVASEGLVP
jgi:hypothetical protein